MQTRAVDYYSSVYKSVGGSDMMTYTGTYYSLALLFNVGFSSLLVLGIQKFKSRDSSRETIVYTQ